MVRYDVFINHRGPDTKTTLVASIKHTLKPMGLEVFLDELELEMGESIPSEIQEAMNSSFLYIAILSPRYAESALCLEELSLMRKTGKPIIPVFYKVDPSDIHWICKGKGIYSKAFSEYKAEERYRSEKLEDWESTLQEVSYLKGHIVNNEHDNEVLKIIANHVLKCSEKTPVVVAKHPVGLDETLQDFKINVLESAANVKIVGIIGMGGCGKTTLAKAYYNKMIRSFYRCSFVCDVRCTSIKNLHKKQRKMFQDLGGLKDISFDSVEKGKEILTDHLRFVQVFVILDNVDHLDQLNSLLPIKDSLMPGSVIVITSRDPSILTSWGIPSNSIYKMKELSPEHTMELFCWHAFRQSSPIDEFEYLVKQFLKESKGLPLFLTVLGGLVHGKSQEFWIGQLDKVSKSLHKDIKNILMVSFDALDKEGKEIFLDISCFFIGTEKHSAIIVWNKLETLIDKCLVEVDEESNLRMHDLLRDLGRDISKTWSPYRLWSPQQITDIIEKQGKEIVQIRGIKAETDEFYEECMELVRGSNVYMRSLEILDVKKIFFTEELAALAARLIWLRWVNFPHTTLPSWISLKELRVLELCEASKLERLWSETADPPVELRVLKILNARSFLRFPRSIGFIKHLQKIIFDCEGSPIEVLPEEFCYLQSLEILELSGCHMLKSLPSKFGDLTSLETLALGDNHHLVEIDSLPISVKNIRLARCSKLESINLNCGLVNLNIEGCGELRKIQGLENCRSLKILNAQVWRNVPLIQSLRYMESLCSVNLTAACHISALEACLQT